MLPLVGGNRSHSHALFRGFLAASVVGGEAYLAQHDGETVGVVSWFGPGQAFLGR